MAESKDVEALGEADQEKVAEPSNLEQKDADTSLEKAPPPSPSTIVDGGIKGWVVAFGGFRRP